MEPYSTDKIKRRKRKHYDLTPEFPKLIIPFKDFTIPLFHKIDIYTGGETMDFKERHPEFQRIMREEFE